MNDEQKSSQMQTRRTVLRAAGTVGLFATAPWAAGHIGVVTGKAPLAVEDHKWEDQLPRPEVLTPCSRNGKTDRYTIELTQFDQTVLPSSMGLDTTVWGYAGSYPAPTIEARPDRPVEVEYINNLPTDHLLSVDQRVHGAEPPAPETRIVTHLHGAVTDPSSDGYPEAWVSPDGKTAADFPEIHDSPVPHRQVKEYPNEQEPATLWYHDHAIGITRLNVYAGLAGFYLLRHPMENSLPSCDYEVPIVIQDRSFDDDGSLFYPDGTDDDYEAEFFGDIPVVNGKAYPYLDVEPRKYRFRFLNGSNGRVFNLKLRNETGTDVPTMNQIATDLGFLESVAPIEPDCARSSLLLSGAERADIVIDFSGFEGQTFTLTNNTPTPYAGVTIPLSESDMPEIMQFQVGDTVTEEDDTIPLSRFLTQINKKYPEPDVTDSGTTRYMTLDTGTVEVKEDIEYDTHFLNQSLWDDEEGVVKPTYGTSEEWVLANVTGDSHPIHLHLVDFEVVGRQTFRAEKFDEARQTGDPDVEEYLEGDVAQPGPGDRGPKDTVLVNPNEAAIIKPAFTGFTGQSVWHCHLLEHEDQEMMLPYEVVSEE